MLTAHSCNHQGAAGALQPPWDSRETPNRKKETLSVTTWNYLASFRYFGESIGRNHSSLNALREMREISSRSHFSIRFKFLHKIKRLIAL